MKVLLINPPYATSEPPSIPMGLLYIGGALEDAGNEVRVLDLLVRRADREIVQKTIEEFSPSIVGITSVTMNWPDSSMILNWVKEIDQSIVTVAGGPHVTFTFREIGLHEPWVDYLVLGEGERTVIEFVRSIERSGIARKINGLAWREGNEMITGLPRELEKDLNSLPKPARHLFPLSRYRSLWADARLSTGRGCPYSCIFCVGHKMVGHRPRLMSPSDIVDEIEELINLGFKEISFSDDHFGMKQAHAVAVCDEIISRGLDADLSIFIRADAAEPNLLEKMRQAGCNSILFGAESGVQTIVDRLKKKINLNILKDKVKLALDMGFHVQVSFILGLPGETLDTVKQTMEYAYNLGTFAGLHVLSPLPGSEIYERAEELGLKILNRDWRLYDANHVVTETQGLKACEMKYIISKHESNIEYLDKMETDAWRRGELKDTHLRKVDRRRCMSFFFELMRNSFFESKAACFNLNVNDKPEDILISNTAKSAGVDENEASKWIMRAINAGDLIKVQNGSTANFKFLEDV